MGRNIKLFKEPNLLKIFIEAPFMKVSVQTLQELIKFLLKEEILLQPYSAGIDNSHSDLGIPTHIHLHGYTKHTESYVKQTLKNYMLNNEYVFDFEVKKKGSYSIVSSSKKVEDEDAFLRYPIKDTLVEMKGWDEEKIKAQSILGKTEYKYKLEQKRKKLKQETNKLNIYEYLASLDQRLFLDEFNQVLISKVKLQIVKYAIENTRLDYLGKFKLEQVALMYLGKSNYWSSEDILGQLTM